jgi:hypothetical protein
MTLRSRLKLLEHTRGQGGRCPECRGRPSTVVVTAYTFIIPDNGRNQLTPRPSGSKKTSTVEANPCPGCGWQPTVIRVGEVLIENHKEERAVNNRISLKHGRLLATIQCPAEGDR